MLFVFNEEKITILQISGSKNMKFAIRKQKKTYKLKNTQQENVFLLIKNKKVNLLTHYKN